MRPDPQDLPGMVRGGIRTVGPTLIVAVVLIIGVLVLLPNPNVTDTNYAATDIGLAAVSDLPDGGRATSSEIEVRAGDRVRLSASVPFSGTVKVYRVSEVDDDRVWPVATDEAERISAGRIVELGEVAVAGDAGVQTWLLSLCPPDAAAKACIVREQKTLCPDRCMTATMRATVVP